MAETLLCLKCHEELPLKNFTNFNRNPALKDRKGRVIYCKDCASKMVVSLGNDKAALKDVLRLLDIPYLEKYSELALSLYQRKLEDTNLVTKTNVHSGKKYEVKVESSCLQSNIYTCYVSKIGIIPKAYINFSYSDGLRLTDDSPSENEVKSIKEITLAKNYISRQFGKTALDDSKLLSEIVKKEFENLDLRKRDTSARQKKYRLKKHLNALIDNCVLPPVYFDFINADDGVTCISNDVMEVDVKSSVNLESKVSELEHEFSDSEIEELLKKWSNYSKKDIVKFEKEYRKLEQDYEIKTAQHRLYLQKACVSSVRLDECLSAGDTDGAKIYSQMFKDFCTQGNLTPSQMAKEESSGVSCFSEWYKDMEKTHGVLNMLPEFIKRPKDDADMVIFCNVQYMRRLKGLPDCEYSDIYSFYKDIEQSYDEEVDIDASKYTSGEDYDDISDSDGDNDE